jgi:hypothetical protein
MSDKTENGRVYWIEIIQVGFILEDMAEIDPFINWFTKRIFMRDLQDANDEIITIRQPVIGPYQNVIINCTYKDKLLELFNFYPTRLSNNRFKMFVSLSFHEALEKNVIWEFFRDIMMEVANDYPEIRRTVINYDFKGPSQPLNDKQKEDLFGTDDKSNNNKIAPNRKGDLDKWKAVWKHIERKKWLAMGMSPATIREFLERDHNRKEYHGTVFSVDTIEKIIKAGLAEELS